MAEWGEPVRLPQITKRIQEKSPNMSAIDIRNLIATLIANGDPTMTFDLRITKVTDNPASEV